MKRKIRTKHEAYSRSNWRHAFVDRVRLLQRRWIKSTQGGRRYFVIPVPTRRGLLRAAIAVVVLAAAVIIGSQLYRYFGPHDYRVSSVDKLLGTPSDILAKDLTFDNEQQVYTFAHGSANTSQSKQTGATLVAARLPVDASKGLTVTDPNYKVDLTMSPHASVAAGKQDKNRVVYPFRDHSGWLIYTASGTGVKEDIVLTHATGDSYQLSYKLTLPSGTEARKEADGSIGIYGNQVFMNNITAATDADASLLEKARANAAKNLLLFVIPKPIVIESGRQISVVKAEFELDKTTLTVRATGLAKANFPLSIDPSIYIVTAQQFMNGNNETNIDFDVADKLIRKSPTTGARFNSWNATTQLSQSNWAGGTAIAGGYLYSAGGISQNGQVYTTQGASSFTVPSGVTSLTVKLWGGGGGGGAGGSAATGGAGGGAGEATGTISVTPGETLTVYVGGGGSAGTRKTAGGGGGGGAYSSIYRDTTALAIAAGGGGGGGGRNSAGNTGGAGGAGGGTTGVAGSTSGAGGGGGAGTQSAGGAGGTGGTNAGSAGSSLTGGLGGDGRTSGTTDGSGASGGLASGGNGGGAIATSRAGGGGGGAGYFGGGGGSSSSSGSGAGGGGGGSSYGTGLTLNAGSGATPGNSADADRAGAGQGGTAGATGGTGTGGSNGIVVINYGAGGTTPTAAVNWMQLSTTDGTLVSPNPGNGSCSGWCTDAAYNLPQARTNFSMVAYNGFLYVVGGFDNAGSPQSTIYIAKLGASGEPQLWNPTWDPATDPNKTTWSYWYTDTGLSSVRSGLTAIAYNNRMYIIGGRTTGTTVVNTVEIADIQPTGRLGSWSTSATLPYNLYNHGSFVYNDRLYIVGGASSVGGAPLSTVYFNKINSTGTLNSWVQTTSMGSGRMSNGGTFTTVWGAYLYISGGCGTVNASGYCTSILSDSDVASINADGSIDTWNAIGTLSDQRTGQSLLAWRNIIYHVGGCTAQNTTTGACTTPTNAVSYGTINQDGDASTVGASVANGTAPCSGGSPSGCNLPGTTYIGNMLTVSFITNGYIYLIGGCTNNACSTTLNTTAYAAISSTGTMSKPTTCPAPRTIQGGMWCVDTTNTTPTNVAAGSPVVFNGRIYIVGGLDGSANTNDLLRADINQTDGSLGAWSTQTLTGLGVNSVSYLYSFARANPADATNNPGNLYILGGCSSSSSAGCTAYSQNVYKCNIQAAGTIASCTTTGQQQIGILPGDTAAGLGIMSGTVYANYIYLIGGVSPNLVDLKTVRYAKIDSNNNIVTAGAGGWTESPYQMAVGRRRSAAFGYNGYLYAVGGYEAVSGVLADIEFIKIDVSTGALVSGWVVSAVEINQRWGLTVPISNSYAYVIGGCTAGASPGGCTTRTDVIQTFQIYNNDSGTPAGYTNAANTYATSPNRLGVSSVVANGYLYAAGGCTGTSDCTSPTADVSYAQLDAYGNIGSWTSTASLPSARAWGKLLVAGGSLYYVGGQDTNGASQSTIYYATPSTGSIPSWSTTTISLPASRTQFGAAVWNNRLYVVAGNTGTANQVIYNTAGTASYTVPTGVSSLTVKAWGAGGGGGGGSGSTGAGGNGGGGGFSQSTITVTSGETLTVNVGTAGKATGNGGGGGGFSALLRSTTYLLQAGGGGGGGGAFGTAAGGNGGPGGGASAAAGNGTAGGGTGGGGFGGGGFTTGGTGGTAGTTGTAGNSGAANLGGDAGGSAATCPTAVTTRGGNGGTGAGGSGGSAVICVSGGGGGGGAFGGGGGGSAASGTNRGSGGGGGGSSIGTTQTVASGTTPGNSTDATRGNAGVGGTGTTTATGTNGTDGTVVIGYGNYTDTATVYVSPQLNNGGDITGAWSTASTSINVARSGAAVVAYANNLYVFGGFDGTNYLSDVQYAQIDSGSSIPANAGLITGSWTYTTSLPKSLSQADAVAANGYIYLIGGRDSATTCAPSTLLAPVSANTTIASGNNPTGVGEWSATNQRFTGNRYGAAAAYSDGKLYVLGGGCGTTVSYPASANTVQQTALLSQPQVAKYSIMIDTDSDVFPNAWLLNGVDNSIGARWQLKYRSMANQNITAANRCATMSTWGQETNFGNVTLGTPGLYVVKDGSGTDIKCGRYFFFNVTVDSSQAFGYPDDVSRGPTITDLTLQFTADPGKRLMHGRTFTGGLQQPLDAPF